MAKWNWQQELAHKDAEIERLRGVLKSASIILAEAGDEFSNWFECARLLEEDGYTMGNTEALIWKCLNMSRAIDKVLAGEST